MGTTTHTTGTTRPRNARAAWQALSESARADLRAGVRTAAVECGLLDAGVPAEELREAAGVLAAQAAVLDHTVALNEDIGSYARKAAEDGRTGGAGEARPLFDKASPFGAYFARRDLALDAVNNPRPFSTGNAPFLPALEALALAATGIPLGVANPKYGIIAGIDDHVREFVRYAGGYPQNGGTSPLKSLTLLAGYLVNALNTDVSSRGKGEALMQAYATLPRARRAELLSFSVEALANRPLLDVMLGVLAQAERAITASSSLEALHTPDVAVATAERLGLGGLITAVPAQVDDSRCNAGYEFAFARGHVRIDAGGSVLCASFRPEGDAAPLEIPGDLLPLWNGTTLALPEGTTLPYAPLRGAFTSPEQALNGLVKVARNLGAHDFDYSTAAIARGRALLAASWMVKEGRLDPADTYIVPLKAEAGAPQRYLYRTRDGAWWRPVPDTTSPVPYVGHFFLAANGTLLPDAEMLPFAKSFSVRLANAQRVNDPHVVGISGPGESLPVTAEHGIPEARDLIYYARTPDGTILALMCKRGDNGAFATFGGFVDPDELIAIDRARARLARTPISDPGWAAANLAYERAMCVPGLRETMEEGFGGEKFLAYGPGRRLQRVYEAALAAGTIQRTSIGRVDGDFRRSEFGAVQTDFIALELPLDLFRELERYTAGSDDAKFAGAIALVENGKVGAFVNGLDMPYHHTMVRTLAERLIAPAT